MKLVWSEHHGAYLYCRQYRASSAHIWPTIESVVKGLCTAALPSLSALCNTNSKRFLCLDTHVAGFPVRLKLHLDAVRAASLVCLIGISLGLGLTSWVLCRLYYRGRKPRLRKVHDEKSRKQLSNGHNCQGLNSALAMGNSEGKFTAGIQVYPDLQNKEELFQDGDGVQHRTTPSRKLNLAASIVDEDTGAYISRSTEAACCSAELVPNGYPPKSSAELLQDKPLNVSAASNHLSEVNDITLDKMKDSGFLETEINGVIVSPAATKIDSLLSNVTDCDSTQNRSQRSSLSDPFHHDLIEASSHNSSGASSRRASCEEELIVELEDIDLDVECAPTNMFVGSFCRDDEIVEPIDEDVTDIDGYQQNGPASLDQSNTLNNKNTECTLESSPLTTSTSQESPSSTVMLSSQSMHDDWTTDSDWTEELSHLCNEIHSDTSSPLYVPRPLSDLASQASPGSVRAVKNNTESSSPSLSHRTISSQSQHSRSSSITSADIEVLSDHGEVIETMENLEQEIMEISDEMTTISSDIRELMLRERGDLYYNVDGVRKLTQVVLNQAQLDITSSELSKAFNILRKYRYSNVATEKESPNRTTMYHEAETFPTPRKQKKSLSHLDLADGLSDPDEQVLERVRSEPPVGKKRKYLLYENQSKQWEVITDDSASQADSECTLDTSVCSSVKLTQSVESINTLALENANNGSNYHNNNNNNASSSTSSDIIQNIIVYAEQEWRGSTPKAQTILQGYHSIATDHNLQNIFKIRGDNYCALRASYCSAILQHEQLSITYTDIHTTMNTLETMLNGEHSYLSTWSFGNRFSLSADVLSTMRFCLQTFADQTRELMSITDLQQRQYALADLFTAGSTVEICLLEAIKLYMYLCAVRLYERNARGEEVPVFVWLMYARDTSDNPAALYKNHLSKVGDSGGLEQVEMFLLAETLGIQLKVFRPSHYGSVDFITYYPEDSPSCGILPLIAEDDRHYNVAL